MRTWFTQKTGFSRDGETSVWRKSRLSRWSAGRATEIADGTKAKIKCVMSAAFSDAVRWEFCFHNPISSGIPVGSGGEERAKHWRTRQCEASGIPLGLVTRRGPTRSGATGISRPASRVSGRRLRNTSRGTRGAALAGLRLQQYELQCATFLLMASGWTPEEHKNGSVREAVADASEPEAGLAGVEVTESLQPAGRFRLSFGTAEGEQTARLSFGVEEKNPTGVQEDRHRGCGVALSSAHGGLHAGRDGRTPTHDPRLLASQQPARHQQVPSGNDKEQAYGTGKARGWHPAWGCAVGKQIKPNPLTPEMTFFRLFGREERAHRHVRYAYWTQTDPDCFWGFSVNHSNEWRGRRDSNPRPLP